MPLSQVSERIKEFPGQALRAVFGGVGQALMAADKVRSRLSEQLSEGSGPAAGERPEQARATPAPPPGPPAGGRRGEVTSDTAAPGTATSGTATPAAAAVTRQARPGAERWRSLDKTGNVRLLDEEEAGVIPASPAAAATPADAEANVATEAAVAADADVDTGADVGAETSVVEAEPMPQTAADAVLAEPDPAAVAGPAPAAVEPILAEPASAEPVPAGDPATEGAPAETAPAVSLAAQPGTTAPGGAELPVPGYDELSVASLRARLRFLDAAGVRTLLEYEKAHQGRIAVITMFERRITKLDEGS